MKVATAASARLALLLVSGLAPSAAAEAAPTDAASTPRFHIKHDRLILDGQPIQLISGRWAGAARARGAGRARRAT